mmetsp:Transcript_7733/g.12105  ORF Transcript_7733/g.12105 Transcript_7733/m.12105 type:complete len:225 (+) Transcript_7733:671-1345(+)
MANLCRSPAYPPPPPGALHVTIVIPCPQELLFEPSPIPVVIIRPRRVSCSGVIPRPVPASAVLARALVRTAVPETNPVRLVQPGMLGDTSKEEMVLGVLHRHQVAAGGCAAALRVCPVERVCVSLPARVRLGLGRRVVGPLDDVRDAIRGRGKIANKAWQFDGQIGVNREPCAVLGRSEGPASSFANALTQEGIVFVSDEINASYARPKTWGIRFHDFRYFGQA